MKQIKNWLPSLIIMILIFMGSNDPVSGEKSDFITRFIWKSVAWITGVTGSPEQQAATTFIIRKLAHITEYFFLALSYYYGIAKTIKINSGNFQKISLLVVSMAVIYSISDEYHQTFIRGRVGTYEDVLIDSIGIMCGYLLINLKIIRQK
jgi:VanZ family protein